MPVGLIIELVMTFVKEVVPIIVKEVIPFLIKLFKGDNLSQAATLFRTVAQTV